MCCSTESTASVIKRWNASVQMSWRMTSTLWDRLAKQRSKADKVPVLNVDMSAAALLIQLDASSLKSLLGMAASVLHYYQYRQYRRLRPQVRLCIQGDNIRQNLYICYTCIPDSLSTQAAQGL